MDTVTTRKIPTRFELVCGRDAVALGIEDENGAWHMERFAAHIQTCEECGRFASAWVEIGKEVIP